MVSRFTKIFLVIISLFSVYNTVFGSDWNEYFVLKYSGRSASKSRYSTIEYLDSRVDTFKMGFVQVGVMNRRANVIFKTDFHSQLQTILDSIVGTTPSKDTLLFQLRSFAFSEVTGAYSETGYCKLRACLYSKKSDKYRKISEIDTVFIIKAFDVTKPLLQEGSNLLETFISANLNNESKDSALFSYNDLANIDSLETRSIPVYTATQYVDGLYYTFNSFKKQVPDKQPSVFLYDDGSIDVVKVPNDKNKLEKVKSKDVYALVYKGKIYIATPFGYYPSSFKKNRLYFIGDVPVGSDAANIAAAGIMFGALGAALAASSPNSARYAVIIDHKDGSFIYYRELPSQSE